MKAFTILDLAIGCGAKAESEGEYTAEEINRVGFDIIGGCYSCGATIGCYNGYATTHGFWACKQCAQPDTLFYSMKEWREYEKQQIRSN